MKNATDGATEIPKVIGASTVGLEPLLEKWRKEHLGVPWSVLIRRGLKKELAPLAGKRHAHLLAA